MSHPNLRAEINAWLASATPEQIAARLERTEHEAFLWHVVTTLPDSIVADSLTRAAERIAAILKEGGYRREY